MAATTATVMTSTPAHDARALDAHLASFYRALLPKDFASGGGDATKAKTPEKTLTTVPIRFDSVREYVRTFEPLILSECEEHVRARSQAGASGAVKATVVRAAERCDEFHVAAFDVSEQDVVGLADNDLVLLSKQILSAKASEDVRSTYALGVVDGRESKTRVCVRLYLPDPGGEDGRRGRTGSTPKSALSAPGKVRVSSSTNESTASYSELDYKRFRNVRNALTAAKGEPWFLASLTNLSTFTREWAATHAFPSFPYANTILSGASAASIGAPYSANAWRMPDGLRDYVERACNDSQIKALASAVTRDPFVLIQGASGTGKTRTIIPLLSVLLHSVPGTSSRADVDFESYAEMRKARAALTAEEKRAAWRQAAPWLLGSSNPRDAPPSLTGVTDQHSAKTSAFATPRPSSSRAAKVVAQTLGANTHKRSKILVCAPSNEALDAIVSRVIKNGLVDGNGETYSPTVVRVGVNVDASVQEVSMDALVSQRLGELGVHVDSMRKFEAAVERDRLKQAILDEASVVFATLSFSGAGMFARMSKQFDVVVVDEATRAVEPSTLVPLCYGARQVYLIGDSRESPANVVSSAAVERNYGMSMFSRFRKCGYPTHSLSAEKEKVAGKRKSSKPEKVHVHDPHWSGAAEFIRSNELNNVNGGFSKEGFRDELIVENTKKGEAVGGDGDDMLADVEDGDDSNRDAFTDTPDEPAKKKPAKRKR